MPAKPNVALDASFIDARTGSGYPHPYSVPCAERRKRPLGDAFELSDFGVNLVTLPAGTWSSQRHWHSAEDELIYVLEGAPTLITDDGETELAPGMCAGFRAGDANGHHLVNNTDKSVVYIEVGSRRDMDDVEYSDIDMQVKARGFGGIFTRKDGSPLTSG
ncbi:MAG: cupin domain-containing protein [Gammaproteobacteria bacterium]|nr:cupin domain-containing protein [Gammaproteobacteria bacterium]